MDALALAIFENPVTFIGYLFALLGAVGVLLFFAGFFGGIAHLFTYSHSASHMEHARTRALWGLYLCMVVFGCWQLLRIILGEAPSTHWILVLILTSPAWAPWLKAILTGKKGGH